MKDNVLDQSTINKFRHDGYVVVPDLISLDELGHYQVAVRNAVSSRKRFDSRPLAARSRYERSFLQCMNLWEDFPDVRPLTFHPAITQAAAELLDADAIRLWHDQALFKESGGRLTDPHQDLPYWPMTESDALTAWIPFSGSTLASGCLGYIPGSHQLGIRKLVNIFNASETELAEQVDAVSVSDPEFVEVPAGSVAFHHALTAHCAKPNSTNDTREVHTMIFFRDGNTRSDRGKHFAVDRAGIKAGAPIASDVTPIAWPLPAGKLPSAPEPISGLSEEIRRSGAYPLT